MATIQGTEDIINPLQKSALNKKSLCDYVVNVASGCLHGCKFCYVPSTPAIRTRQKILREKGVENPQMEWGEYLFVREEIPQKLKLKLSRQRSWQKTDSGQGVVLLCSGTDPYQNAKVARITRATIEILLEHNKRIRVLTRSPLWLKDLDILKNPNVTIGMSIPYLDDKLSRQIEPHSPLPSVRVSAMAPTHPGMSYPEFYECLEALKKIEPEVIFWEPINARGTNGKRMVEAGLSFAKEVMDHKAWAASFIRQWIAAEKAAIDLNVLHLLHVWPDRELSNIVETPILDYWWYRPTQEKWDNDKSNLMLTQDRPLMNEKLLGNLLSC